jgi:hypothetical protein
MHPIKGGKDILSNYMRTIFFTLVFIFSLLSCENKSQPDIQRQLKCYVRILETEGEVLAEATMQQSDATKPVMQPVEVAGGIRYQGTGMGIKPQYGLTYRSQFKGRYSPEHVFSWDDAKGNRYTFKTNMFDVNKYTFGKKTLSRKQRAVLSWEGQPINTGESLVLLWENQKENLTVPMEIYGAQPTPGIEFPAAKIAELNPGTWTLYLVRKRLIKENINGVPAEAILEFYSQTDTLNIVD